MTTAIEYALMAGHAYRTTREQINWLPAPQGWTPFFPVPDPKTPTFPTTAGFEAISFTNGTDIVISFAGTDSDDYLGDIAADIALANGLGSWQLLQAAKYYLQVKAANPTANITYTGHSLGGGLAALMGAFFNEDAFTFDQAPFRNSANGFVANDLLVKLKLAFPVSSYPQVTNWLAPLERFTQDGLAAREGNVTNINVQGEFLSVPPAATLYDRIGAETEIPNSANGVKGVELHSQALLTAFLQSIQTAAGSQTLNGVTFKLPDLLKMIFDDNLYNRETKGGKENFLERLVRHQEGVQGSFAADGMVTRFTADLWKIAQDGGLTVTSNSISKTLIAFAMQMYYEKTTAADKQLFTDVAGGIRFDRSDVASSLTAAKGYQYFRDYLEILPSAEREIIDQQLPALLDWFIQAGGGAMSATAAGRAAFMLGGAGGDSLTGSDQADVLVGNGGADTLTGGLGDDSLLGGAGGDTLNGGDGYDTYIIEGNDTIRDSDGKGRIRGKAGNVIAGGIEKLESGSYVYLADPTVGVAVGSSLILTWTDGSRIDIEGFNNGDLGFVVTNFIKELEPQNVILGDQAPLMLDSVTPQLDRWGNIIPIGPAPGRDDIIYDTDSDDLIDAGGGVDFVTRRIGGDDIIEMGAGDDRLHTNEFVPGRVIVRGGDGRDYLEAGIGDDIMEGGADADAIYGSGGDDQIYGSDKGLAFELIAQGATQQGTGKQGDWLNGGGGDDQIFGGAGNDFAVGAMGSDLIVTGGGSDWIWGDWYVRLTYEIQQHFKVNQQGELEFIPFVSWKHWTITETLDGQTYIFEPCLSGLLPIR